MIKEIDTESKMLNEYELSTKVISISIKEVTLSTRRQMGTKLSSKYLRKVNRLKGKRRPRNLCLDTVDDISKYRDKKNKDNGYKVEWIW